MLSKILQKNSNLDFRLILILDYSWSYFFHQTFYNLCKTFVLEEPLIFVFLIELTADNLWKSDIPVSNIFVFLSKYAFLFATIRSMQEDDTLKRVGFFLRCSKSRVYKSCCKFLFSGVILKSPTNITFSYKSRYMEINFLDKSCKNIDLL